MATQTIPDFTFTPERYALHNARPEPIDFMWNGMRFTIPGIDAVGLKPSTFEDGTPVPGTLVIQDAYATNADGELPTTNSAPNWRAKEALRNVLGVNPATGAAEGQIARNGVSLVPLVCTRAQFEAIKRDGMARYKESLVGWAMDTVSNYEQARSKAKEAGVDPKPPGPEFYKAQQVLKLHNEALRKSLGVEADIIREEAEDDEVEFKAFLYAHIQKQAEKVAEATNVDKAKLVESLLQDPAVQAQVRKKYSVRRKGYMDPEAAPGAEQPPEDAA